MTMGVITAYFSGLINLVRLTPYSLLRQCRVCATFLLFPLRPVQVVETHGFPALTDVGEGAHTSRRWYPPQNMALGSIFLNRSGLPLALLPALRSCIR
ncbi:uncharacterized protein TEOVI_000765500 [Trypanosoma equiperdum]|uniref:Uncharacterized protein n=2 Tax=Trypanozoon TaxID=39700 RepID=Q38EP2_TRYB2|nr:hypothetical protein, unlikely [Trypanosoma brucei brucei TREU927]EAN76728.1 hypothetical protein, unlikely [Trypanosoma brucei brucei TREU927]SCU64952.1 hypothetical protein, conserved [Trypanosoma equiperdum]